MVRLILKTRYKKKLSISRTFRETFRKISGEISKVKDGFNDVKNKVDRHTEELNRINKTVGDKQKWNIGIATAIVTGIFGLLSAAMQLAPVIFK